MSRMSKVCNQKICKKCKYRGIVISGTITCDYISITGKKRGCPAGDCDKFIKGNPSKKKELVIGVENEETKHTGYVL